MKFKDVESLVNQNPGNRAMQMLKLGAKLGETKQKKPGKLAIPASLNTKSIMNFAPGQMLKPLHGSTQEMLRKTVGLSKTGRTLKTATGKVVDQVLTPRGRKESAKRAMKRTTGESIRDLAVRQLGIGMLDSNPYARVCAAYAYWQATGLTDAVVPILSSAIESTDYDEQELSAMCLAHIDRAKVRILEGTAKDDKPQTPIQPTKASMTVLIHGTFAKDSAWYKPKGDFHNYIKKNVYSDVYTAADFYFWSGRYALDDTELKKIWTQAAKKLVSWCISHPTKKLRLIAHSHGCNVVNIAMQRGLKACSLIQLSPPVRAWNLPDMGNVSSNRLFNIHSTNDPVVFVDGGAQDYSGTVVSVSERTKIISFVSHSDSHAPKLWKKKAIPKLVKTVCQ